MEKQLLKESNETTPPFLKITHRNSNTFLDDEALIQLKLSLYTTLASIEEEIIGREINKLFDRLIPNYEDLFKVNVILAKKYYDTYYSTSIDNTGLKIYEDVKNSLDSILNKNYNMEFYFFNTYIEEVCKVLVYSYLELSNCGRLFSNAGPGQYKITNQSEFIKAVENIVNRNVDVIKRYRDRENYSNNNYPPHLKKNSVSVCSNSTRSSFSSGGASTFRYTHSNRNEFEIPTEMILLLNRFQSIKKLKLFVPSVIDDLTPFIMILLNLEWLFPNLFEVELDLTNSSLHKDICDAFSLRGNFSGKNSSRKSVVQNYNPNQQRKSVSSYSSNSSLKYTSDYNEIIKTHKNNFELIIVYSYFISKMEKLKIFDLIFADSFQKETEEALKLSDVYTVNFQFLNFFIPITNLYQLNVEFNSLDSGSFEKILSLFHKNNPLKSFKISLFTGEENYSLNALMKLCSVLNMRILNSGEVSVLKGLNNYSSKENILKNNSISNSISKRSSFNNSQEDLTEQILSLLLNTLEENLEKFFFIFQTKMNLFEFHLKADLPQIISINENYIITFQKFLFNFFTLLNNENLSLQTLKLYIPFLSFDNRKYPGICKFLDTVNLRHKQQKMSNLTIFLQFYKCHNISNLISTHLKFLQIGDLDIDTLSSLLSFLANPEFVKMSQLTCLKIFLSNFLFDFKTVLKELEPYIKFMKGDGSKNIDGLGVGCSNLKEFSIGSNIIIQGNGEDFLKLFNLINNDRIEKYCFEFNKRSCDIYNELQPKLGEMRYRVENKKVNRNIVKTLMCLWKISQKGGKEKKEIFKFKIFTQIQKFLEFYEKKDVTVSFK